MFEKIKKLFRKNNEAYAVDSEGNRIEVEILPADWTPEKEREYQAQRLMKEYEDAQKEKAKQIIRKEAVYLSKKAFKVILLAFIIPMTIMFIAKQFGINLPYFVAVLIYFFAESIFKSLFFKKH
jgi:hypothetical protein